MTSITHSIVSIQASAQSVPSTPSWLGEVALIVHHLQRQGVLAAIEEQVRFARRRFGRYEVIDFLAVLLGYAISSERTLEAFYARINPWASAFMALFGRDRLPARSPLSRFLASLDQTAVESLPRLRCGWHTRGGPPTCPAEDGGSARSTATFAPPVCAWLHGTQARGSR